MTTEDFLIKGSLLVAATAASSLQWSVALSPDAEALFHLGALLPTVIAVLAIAVIPGGLFFGVVALEKDWRTRDHARTCFLMGLYVVTLWMVYFKVAQIVDMPRPTSAMWGSNYFLYVASKGAPTIFLHVAYVCAFFLSLPGVRVTRTQQEIAQEKARRQQIAPRSGINRWLLVAACFLLAFSLLLFSFVVLSDVEPTYFLALRCAIVSAGGTVLYGLGMLLADWVNGRLRFWKIASLSLEGGTTSRSKTRDWSAMAKALIDSKNWNGLLLLTDDWQTAERGNHQCWAAKGIAHENLRELYKAISAYRVSLKICYDETVAKRLDALLHEAEKMRQFRAREEQERTGRAEGGRGRASSSKSGNMGSGGSQHLTDSDRHYRILGIQPGATIEEVKAAYRRRMQEYHPDKVASLGKELRDLAEEKSKEINKAYRAIVDTFLYNTARDMT